MRPSYPRLANTCPRVSRHLQCVTKYPQVSPHRRAWCHRFHGGRRVLIDSGHRQPRRARLISTSDRRRSRRQAEMLPRTDASRRASSIGLRFEYISAQHQWMHQTLQRVSKFLFLAADYADFANKIRIFDATLVKKLRTCISYLRDLRRESSRDVSGNPMTDARQSATLSGSPNAPKLPSPLPSLL